MERTKQFGKEVVDLLRHQPHCRMPFSKFIPTYHHHFGRQCKLSYYGFTKLIELFEAIPEVLMVSEARVTVTTDLLAFCVFTTLISFLNTFCGRPLQLYCNNNNNNVFT